MLCNALHDVPGVGAGSGGCRGGLWDERLGLPLTIHKQFQMPPTNLLQGTTEHLNQNGGILVGHLLSLYV